MCKCSKADALSNLLLDIYKLNECLEDIKKNNHGLRDNYSFDLVSGSFSYFFDILRKISKNRLICSKIY